MNRISRTLVATLFGTLATLQSAQAAPAEVFEDRARVVEVEPIVKVVRIAEPRHVCRKKREVRREHHHASSAAPVIAGGIIGGVVGHQVGKGRGKDAATVTGALIGLAIGDDIARKNHRRDDVYTVSHRRCTTVQSWREEERIEGYWVKYRYRGKTFTTRMDHDPGQYVAIRITVQPVAGAEVAWYD